MRRGDARQQERERDDNSGERAKKHRALLVVWSDESAQVMDTSGRRFVCLGSIES